MNQPRPIPHNPKETAQVSDNSNRSKDRLSTTRTRNGAAHTQPTAAAQDVDATDSRKSLPFSQRQPTPTAQGLPPPSITDLTTPEHTAAVRAKHIRAIVDSFPPLTSEQRDRIATLLRTHRNRKRP